VGVGGAVWLSGRDPSCPAGCGFAAQMCSHLLPPGCPIAELTWFSEAVSTAHSEIGHCASIIAADGEQDN